MSTNFLSICTHKTASRQARRLRGRGKYEVPHYCYGESHGVSGMITKNGAFSNGFSCHFVLLNL